MCTSTNIDRSDAKAGLQRSIELCDAVYTGCWHSLRLGKRAKIELRQAATHALRQSEMAGEIVEGFVGAVLDNNERELSGRRLQLPRREISARLRKQRVAVAAGMSSVVWPTEQHTAKIVIFALPDAGSP